MPQSLSSIRKSRGYSQGALGLAIADRLKLRIGKSYAQRKIARFEAGAAAPSAEELKAMAVELDTDPEVLRTVIASRAPLEGSSMIDQIAVSGEGGRSLIASCVLSRTRPQTLAESYLAISEAIKKRRVSIAVFVPYPSVINVSPPSDHINNLFAYYYHVRRSISESNLLFKNSLGPKYGDAVGLYFPKTGLIQNSALLVPPVFRQFSVTFQLVGPNTQVIKSLHMWTPGSDTDTARPIRATGVYTLDEQIDAWESYFGGIVPHWTATGQLASSDPYWERIR